MSFFNTIKSGLSSDRAENSIMQTITIAVSAILVASGLVTAPGLINNARDNNARTDLANIAYSEEFVMADTGKYISKLRGDSSLSSYMSESGAGVKLTLSGAVSDQEAIVCNDPEWAYLVKATSASGKTFFRASNSAVVSSDISAVQVAQCVADDPKFPEFLEESTAPGTTPGGSGGNNNGPSMPVITNTPLPNGSIGQPYSYQFASTGTPVFSGTDLPAGLTLSTSGILSGTPEQNGKTSFTVKAQNQAGTSSINTTLTVGQTPNLNAIPARLPDTAVDAPYSYKVEAEGFPAPVITATGLPAGLTITPDGLISGTPKDISTYTVALTATNSIGKATKSVTVRSVTTYSKATLETASIKLPTAVIGEEYDGYQFSAQGSPEPVFTSNRSLPTGMTLSKDGELSGTPTDFGSSGQGTTALFVNLTNVKGVNTYSIPLPKRYAGDLPVMTTTAEMPTGVTSEVYPGFTVTASGTPKPTYSASSLPAGLTINRDTGVVSGTPTASYNGDVVFTATNQVGSASVTKRLTISFAAYAYTQNFQTVTNGNQLAELKQKRAQDAAQTDVSVFVQNSTLIYLSSTGKGIDYFLTLNFAPGVYEVSADVFQTRGVVPWTISNANGSYTSEPLKTNAFNTISTKLTFTQSGNQQIKISLPASATSGIMQLDNLKVTRVG
jgi:hypothetical protein